MKKFLKTLTIVMCALVLVAGSVAGTFAYLTAKTESITNTFTAGNIEITLGETTGSDYKMVPGTTIAKDPKVTVLANSEDCWLFVKVEKSENYDTFMQYTIADGWEELETGVYYREVTLREEDQAFSVLEGDQVTAKTEPTKADYDATRAEGGKKPTLTFTAYAVQKVGFDTATAAWTQAETLD